MATLQALTVDLGMDNSDLLDGLARARKAIRSFRDDVEKASKRIESMNGQLARLGKPTAMIGLAKAGGALAKGIAPAAGALFALPAAGAAGAAAMATVETATSGVSEAMDALATGSAEDVAKAMQNLSPEAREVARSLHAITDEYDDVRRAVQDEVFAGMSERIDKLGNRYLPELEDGMTDVGGALNDLASQAASAVDSKFFQGVVASTFDSATNALEEFTPAIGPLANALANVVDVGLPMVEQFAEWAAKGVEAKAGFLASAEGAKWMTGTLKDAKDTLKTLGDIAGNVKDTIGGIFEAAGGDGSDLLGTIEKLTGRFAEWVNSAEGQKQIRDFLDQFEQFVTVMQNNLPRVLAIIEQMLKMFNSLPEPVQNSIATLLLLSVILGPVTGAVKGLGWALGGVFKLLQRLGKSKWVEPIKKKFGKFRKSTDKTARSQKKATGRMSGMFKKMGKKIGKSAMGAAISFLSTKGVYGLAAAAIIAIIWALWANWDKISKWINKAFDWLNRQLYKAARWFLKQVADIVDTFRELPGRIRAAIGDLGNLLVGAGKDIMRGLLRGIDQAWAWVRSKLAWITSQLPNWKGPMSVDLKLLEPSGRALMQGLQVGISDEQTGLKRQLQDVTSMIGRSVQPEVDGDGADGTSGARSRTPTVRVEFAGDEAMKKWIRRVARVDGHGSVEAAFGS